MPANTIPIFTKQGNFKPARVSAANTASDGSGALVTLVTSAVDGSRIDGIRVRNAQATAAASSAMVCKIFLSDVLGTNPRLVGEMVLAAATRSTTVIGATNVFTFDNPIIMLSGQILTVTQSVYAGAQDQNDYLAFSSDF